MLLDVPMGAETWTLAIADDRLLHVPLPAGDTIADVRAAVRVAMERPRRLDFPLRRAMTPDDRIALVVDEQVPSVGELVTGVLEYLASAGIGPDYVTIVTTPGSGQAEWIDALPDEFADVHTEVHQPGDRKQMSYLAASKLGRRIYLNRTLVDADQIIAISGRRYDPQLGYTGAEAGLYPVLSDDETRRTLDDQLTNESPTPEPNAIRAEAAEIAWLLGSPIFVQAIEAGDGGLADILAGLIDSSGDGIAAQDAHWKTRVAAPVDIVLATVRGRGDTFEQIAMAAAAAARAVRSEGIIVLLTDLDPVLGEGMELLRQSDDYSRAFRVVADKRPRDRATVVQWMAAATHARLFLASGLRPEIVEELFATPILSPGEVQRLLDAGGTCLYLPDADKRLVVVDE